MKVGELEGAIRRARNLFDAWNNVTGQFPIGSSYYAEICSCIDDAVHCGAQAATGDYRRLEGEEGPIPGLIAENQLIEEDLNGPLDRKAYEATLPAALALLHCNCIEGDDNAPDHMATCNLVVYPARGTLPTGLNDGK